MQAYATNPSRPEEGDEDDLLKTNYLKLLTLIERLHRQLLDVIKDELDRVGQTDINSVQALLLFNIGDAELTAGELRSRGHYLGSNVSYNLKKLVESGYINHQRSSSDKRSVRVKLTPAGQDVCAKISALFDRQLGSVVEVGGVSAEAMGDTNKSLLLLERFWGDQIRYRL